MTIGVLGDIFIDRYLIGSSNRVSAEVPIPVVKIEEVLTCPGGAANVRENLESLEADGVLLTFHPSLAKNIPVKNRLMVGSHQIARWDENDWSEPFSPNDLAAFPPIDGLIVADYGKGAIQKNLIDVIISAAQERELKVFVDTKRNPTDWLECKNVVMFPNQAEYKQYEMQYEWFPKVILKQSENGLALVQHGQIVLTSPSLAQYVVSVNGAGDTVIASYTIASLMGKNEQRCLSYANAAAAVVVGKPYTAVATPLEVDTVLMSKEMGCLTLNSPQSY